MNFLFYFEILISIMTLIGIFYFIKLEIKDNFLLGIPFTIVGIIVFIIIIVLNLNIYEIIKGVIK